MVIFCGWFCFLCVWIFRKRYDVLGKLLKGFLIVKEDFLCVVRGFYARFVCGFEAIARVLLEVWLGFYSFYNRSICFTAC